jgi:hypothetical protein
MCDPLSIGLGAVAIGSQVAGDIAANKAAEKQRKAIEKAANASLEGQLADLQARAKQEREAAQFQVQQDQELSLAELGLAQASAADSGVTGGSVDALTSSLKRRATVSRDITGLNLQNVLEQLSRGARGAIAERDSRVAGAPQGTPAGVIALNALNTAIPLIPR